MFLPTKTTTPKNKETKKKQNSLLFFYNFTSSTYLSNFSFHDVLMISSPHLPTSPSLSKVVQYPPHGLHVVLHLQLHLILFRQRLRV